MDFDNNKPTYKTKNIYNIKVNLQKKNLDILSSIYIFIQN